MNYWPRWIGSIQKKTSHLSLAEMGAYDRLLDHYYANEAPLPADLDRCCRICGATAKSERAAVAAVLAEFFLLTDAGYTNDRATHEIAYAKPKADAARANGVRGGRPRGTHKKPTGFSEGTQVESSSTSTTEIQPPPRKRGAPPAPEGVSAEVWESWLELRRKKRAPVTDTVVAAAMLEAEKARMPLEAFLTIWCFRGSQGLMAEWLKPEERRQGSEPDFVRQRREQIRAMSGGLVSARPPQPEIIDGIGIIRAVG